MMTLKTDFDHPEWVSNAIFYEIFPDRFFKKETPTTKPGDLANWGDQPSRDNFFGGNLPDTTEKLDYLEELGITAIYLTPVFKAPSNHKYDTEDYMQVDSAFGDKDDLVHLVKKAHSKEIRVVLDGVFNHCGEQFFAFQDVVNKGEQSQYKNWFTIHEFPLQKEPEPTYACWAGVLNLPEFNLSNPEVQDYLLQVVEYWIEYADIDGWRIDAATYLPASFIRKIKTKAKEVKSDAYVFGESMGLSVSWFKSGIVDGIMNYKLAEALSDYCAKQPPISGKEFQQQVRSIRHSYPNRSNYGHYNLLDSHDTPRFLTKCNGDVDRLKIALVFLFTYTGAPAIFYGDEVGLEGREDPDCRQTMIWNNPEQNKDLHGFYKKLIDLRKTHRALRVGNIYQPEINKKVYCHIRVSNKETLITVLNNRDPVQQYEIQSKFLELKKDPKVILGETRIHNFDLNQLAGSLTPYGFAVLRT